MFSWVLNVTGTGTAGRGGGGFPWEEAVKVSLNIQLMRIELMISEDWEHGTKMDHIMSAPTTQPVNQVGNTAISCRIKIIKSTVTVIVC
jgi:hypothetical protein